MEARTYLTAIRVESSARLRAGFSTAGADAGGPESQSRQNFAARFGRAAARSGAAKPEIISLGKGRAESRFKTMAYRGNGGEDGIRTHDTAFDRITV